jgi:hypothetical protein
MAPAVQQHPGARTTRRLTDVAKHSVAAGDPIAYAARIKAQEELLEAAERAQAWFDRFDRHAPEGLAFGGEGSVRRQLRQAIRKVGDAEEGR